MSKRTGRPPTTINARHVERLAAVLTQEQIGDFFGVSGRTLRNHLAQDPKLSSAYKRGRSRALQQAGGKLLGLVRKGNLGAICFYLKTQGGWRETTHTELTGADGGPIQLQTDELRTRLVGRIAGLADRLAVPAGQGNGNGRHG